MNILNIKIFGEAERVGVRCLNSFNFEESLKYFVESRVAIWEWGRLIGVDIEMTANNFAVWFISVFAQMPGVQEVLKSPYRQMKGTHYQIEISDKWVLIKKGQSKIYSYSRANFKLAAKAMKLANDCLLDWIAEEIKTSVQNIKNQQYYIKKIKNILDKYQSKFNISQNEIIYILKKADIADKNFDL